jgi:STE24 endopeptidase
MTVCDSEPVDRGRLRLPLALIAAVAVAEAAVLLLRPRDGIIEPANVSAGSYFSPHEIERARDFRRPQLALYGGTLLVEGALLAWLVLRPPARLRGPFRRPVAVAALTGAALSLALAAAPLPLSAVARQRSIDVGLTTQSWEDWAGDVAKSWGIGAVLAGAGAAMGIRLMRRFGPRWWMPGSVVVVAVGAGFLYAGPVLLDPIFNKFTPLPEGRTRSDVLALAQRAGVRVGEVYEVDASRRTTAANAYVTGLGSTKRVVLYDTLLQNFTREETRLVVAHELGHVHYRDVPHGLLYLAIVAPFALLAAARLTERLAPGGEPGPSALPALALSIAIVSLPVTTISNQLSRRIEARADSFSLRLTEAPEPFVSFERRITLRNVSDPDPPDLVHALLGTHPTTMERIGIAKAFEAGER